MTASTLPLLVLIAFLWWRTKGQLLPIILFTSIFDAAAALTVAGSPVAPWLFALIVCLPIQALTGKLRIRPVPGINRGAFRALVLFVGYAALSALLYPLLFHGILVSNSHNGLNQHLSLGITNFTQTTYLLAAFTVFLLAVHSSREQLRSAVQWYIRACVCIALFSLYQLANATLHVPFPSAVLYTNTAHTIYDAYKINGVWRLNSTLTEASEAALYLGTGLALLGWHMVAHRIRWQSAASFLLILTALVLTVSTVGYCCLAIIALGGALFFVHNSFRGKGAAPAKVLALLAVVAVAVPLFTLTSASETVTKVFDGVFVDKVDSDSYRERTLWNTLALQTSHDSLYFGAGWGSVRASSFVCSLLANAGIPGALLFLYFLFELARPLLRPRRYVRFELYERSLFGLAVVLTALAVASPDPIEPIIWVLFAVATASKPRRAPRFEPASLPQAPRRPRPALRPQSQE